MSEQISRNCIKIDNTIIKTTRHTPGMAEMGYVGFGNELHRFTYTNEIVMLSLLKDFTHVPNLLGYDDNKLTISMSYCGERVNEFNLPTNWIDQMVYILDVLKDQNISHNDIKPTDILVQDGKLMLIDFGWAINIDNQIPDDWPISIGGEYKYRTKKFNDSYSFLKSIKSII